MAKIVFIMPFDSHSRNSPGMPDSNSLQQSES